MGMDEEWTQFDMNSMPNSVPSRSEVDDIIEATVALHHKVVASLQVEFQKKREETEKNVSTFGEQVFYACPNVSVDSAEAMAYHHSHRIIEGERKMLELSIHAMEGVTAGRIQDVMEHYGIDVEETADEVFADWEE